MNAEARRRYEARCDPRQSAAAMVPVELFPPPAPGEFIGCLRCRHAKAGINTEFTGVRPGGTISILCEKQDREVNLCWESCPLADPRPAQPKHLRKYWFKYGPLGDLAGDATPLFREFLRAAWTRWPAAALQAVSGYSMDKLRSLVRYHGIGGIESGRHRMRHMDVKKGRACFTKEQSDWLLAEYRSPRWPKPYVYCMRPATKAAITRNRNRIVEHVAELGPHWNWEQIQRHIQKRQQTEFRRGKRRGVRKVNQFAVVMDR